MKGGGTVAISLFNGQNVDILWFYGMHVYGHVTYVFCKNKNPKQIHKVYIWSGCIHIAFHWFYHNGLYHFQSNKSLVRRFE